MTEEANDSNILESVIGILKEDEKSQDDTPSLRRKLETQRDILKKIVESFKNFNDDKVIMEALKTENEHLFIKLTNEKTKCRTLRKKFRAILKNHDLFNKMKEEYRAMSHAVNDNMSSQIKGSALCVALNRTSKSVEACVPFRISDEVNETLQASLSFTSGEQGLFHKYESPREGERDSKSKALLSITEIDKLGHDISTLKHALHFRDITWNKLASRERTQRLQLMRLSAEVTNLRHLATTHQTEIDIKNQKVKELTELLQQHKIEIGKLKKNILRMQRREKELTELYELNLEMQLKNQIKFDEPISEKTISQNTNVDTSNKSFSGCKSISTYSS